MSDKMAIEKIYRYILADCPEKNLGECSGCLFEAKQIHAIYIESLGYVPKAKYQKSTNCICNVCAGRLECEANFAKVEKE
ncbi:MAG: hypothetical protein MUP81_00165 [Dehalococcoidia bacterium]|nr:hypothetical protein [Dehalococcoidia bacterium]